MLSRLYSWYGKSVVWGIAVLVIILIVIGVFLSTQDTETVKSTETNRLVAVQSVSMLSNTGDVELIGTIESLNRAVIQSEATGRVTSVNVGLGDSVRAGQVIGQLANANEQAAVLQAEGAYEATLASAAQSNTGVGTALTSLQSARESGITTYRSAFNAVDSVIRNTVDKVFSDPTGRIPGLLIDGAADAPRLNDERIRIENMLKEWAITVNGNLNSENTPEYLEEAARDLRDISGFVNEITNAALDTDNDGAAISNTDIATLRNELIAARTNINTTMQNVTNALSQVDAAEDALTQAEIAGTGGVVSTANAQVKQALGALRAAQANYEKTIFRSPIAGSVNSLSIKTGDFVGSFDEIAVVANNNAFEITTYVSETDAAKISVGDTVEIEGNRTGTITAIAPAVQEATKKIEVRIATEASDLASGNTLRVRIPLTTMNETTEIRIPITALKVEADRIVVFSVASDNTLVAHQVSEGPLVGDSIIITEGITSDMEIVVDARGLNEGDEVQVNPNS